MKFLWKGIQAGDFSSGVMDALTEEEAVYLLKQQGVIITEIYSDESVSPVKTAKVSVETPKI